MLRVDLTGFRHGLEMMAVTLVLMLIEPVINSQAIADQNSGKLRAQYA